MIRECSDVPWSSWMPWTTTLPCATAPVSEPVLPVGTVDDVVGVVYRPSATVTLSQWSTMTLRGLYQGR